MFEVICIVQVENSFSIYKNVILLNFFYKNKIIFSLFKAG